MKKVMGILILALAVAVNGHAGQKDAKKVEKVSDPKQVQQEREAIAEDCADLDRLSDLTMKYDELAVKGAQAGELNRVRTQIEEELRRGVDESKKQAKEAKQEAKQEAKKEAKKEAQQEAVKEAKAEGKKESAEAKGKSEDEGKKTKAQQTDSDKKAAQQQAKKESKEAKSELKQKQADAKKAGEMLKKKRAVAVKLREVQRKMDAGDNSEAMQKKQAELLKEYGELSREEVKKGFRTMKKETKESPESNQEKGKGSGKGQ